MNALTRIIQGIALLFIAGTSYGQTSTSKPSVQKNSNQKTTEQVERQKLHKVAEVTEKREDGSIRTTTYANGEVVGIKTTRPKVERIDKPKKSK